MSSQSENCAMGFPTATQRPCAKRPRWSPKARSIAADAGGAGGSSVINGRWWYTVADEEPAGVGTAIAMQRATDALFNPPMAVQPVTLVGTADPLEVLARAS